MTVESASLHVIPEGETKISGWSLLSPVKLNTRHCDEGFIEKVVLLSDKAVYAVSYDCELQKVSMQIQSFIFLLILYMSVSFFFDR